MNTLTREDFASEAQIARNHARVSELTDCTGNLLADWDAEQRAVAEARRIAYLAERTRRDAERVARLMADLEIRHQQQTAVTLEAERIREIEHARRACGSDLPLFARPELAALVA